MRWYEMIRWRDGKTERGDTEAATGCLPITYQPLFPHVTTGRLLTEKLITCFHWSGWYNGAVDEEHPGKDLEITLQLLPLNIVFKYCLQILSSNIKYCQTARSMAATLCHNPLEHQPLERPVPPQKKKKKKRKKKKDHQPIRQQLFATTEHYANTYKVCISHL